LTVAPALGLLPVSRAAPSTFQDGRAPAPTERANPLAIKRISLQTVGGEVMTRLKHWQDAVNVVLGAWLVLSPWAMGYAGEAAAMANAIVIGVALIAAALGAIFVPRAWEEWTEGVLGLWLIVSPWVLGFTAMNGARLTAVVTGIAIAALALWTLFSDKDYSAWWRDRMAH